MNRNLRVLIGVTVALGVLILLGTTVVIVTIARRMAAPHAGPQAAIALHLDAPAGARIGAIAGAGDRLAIELEGAGADRVVLIDPNTGAITGQITLGR